MKLSPFVRFFELIDALDDVHEEFFENKLQSYRAEFVNRGWVRQARYLTHHMADYFDDKVEVEIEIDPAEGVYRYPDPQRLGRAASAPLWEVTLYAINLQKWLDDLSDFIGIAPENRPGNRDLVANHAWCLGEINTARNKVSTKVILARRQSGRSDPLIKECLDDRFDPGEVIVLVDAVSKPKAFGEHLERSLADFVDFSAGHSSFDTKMLERIAIRGATQRVEKQPEEYLNGKLLKLAHFPEPIELAPERLKIVIRAWGQPEKDPPVVTWVEINRDANTGYASFDDAFGSAQARGLIFAVVSRGKYRLRRSEMHIPVKSATNSNPNHTGHSN